MDIWKELYNKAKDQYYPTDVSPFVYAHTSGVGGMPCGACREFLMQLSFKNKDIEIMVDYKKRETIRLEELLPNWWGIKRYEENNAV